jgi:hypothetical protein
MAGVARTFDEDLDDDAIDFSNVMAEPMADHCSAVWCSRALAADGQPRVGRNLDFSTRTLSEMLGAAPGPGEPAALSRPFLVETHPARGYASIVSTVGDLTSCLDGINDQGLVVALLADDESQNLRPTLTPQAGLNEMHLPRYLLDRCTDTEESLEALYEAKQYDQYAVAHYLVADADRAFVWERDTHNVERVVFSEGGILNVTNYLLHREGIGVVPEDRPDNASAHEAYGRGRILNDDQKDKAVTEDGLWDLLESVRADARADETAPAARTRTLWHVQFDIESRSSEYEFYLGDLPDGGPVRSRRVDLALSSV